MWGYLGVLWTTLALEAKHFQGQSKHGFESTWKTCLETQAWVTSRSV